MRAARAKIEARIAAAAPDYMRFFTRLKQLLPHEYDTILDGFARQSLEGADMTQCRFASLGRGARLAPVRAAAWRPRRTARRSAASSPCSSAMMQALAAKDPEALRRFPLRRREPGLFRILRRKIAALVADMAIAGLDAINDGRAKKIERQPPSDKDFELLETALKAKQMSETEIAAILDGKIPSPPIANDRMCQVGQIYLETLAELPEPARFRIYGLAVELMARS